LGHLHALAEGESHGLRRFAKGEVEGVKGFLSRKADNSALDAANAGPNPA
jgi:hypothetical protein